MKQYNLTKIRFLSVIIALFFTISTYAQKTIPNSFSILNNTSKFSEEFITECILKANFETYRNKDSKTQIIISNGFTIELLSAKEIFIKNNTIKMENYSRTINPQNVNLELLENGFFMQKIATITNPKKKSFKK